jgi:hypothetical protein
MRSGVIAKKLGMTRLFLENGAQVPVTVLQLDNLQVVAQRTADKDGYTAVQLGAGAAKAKRTTAAMRGHFAKASVEPKRKIAEFRVSPDNLIEVGAEITADHYLAGQYVDIAFVHRTVCRFRTVRTVRPASVRIRARCSRARRWLAILVPFAPQPRTWKLCGPMLTVV